MDNRWIFLYLSDLFEQWKDTGGETERGDGNTRPSNKSDAELNASYLKDEL